MWTYVSVSEPDALIIRAEIWTEGTSGIEVEREYFKQKRRAQHISGTEGRPVWPKRREEGKKWHKME